MQSQKENQTQPNLNFGVSNLVPTCQEAIISNDPISGKFTSSVFKRTMRKAAAFIAICTFSVSFSFAQCWTNPEDETEVVIRTTSYNKNAEGSTTFHADHSAFVSITNTVSWSDWSFISFASGKIRTKNSIDFSQTSNRIYIKDLTRVEFEGPVTMNGGANKSNGNYIYIEEGGELSINTNIKAFNTHNYIVLAGEGAKLYMNGVEYFAGQIIQTGADASTTIKILSCIDGPIDGPLPVKFVGKPSITKLDAHKIKVSFQVEEQMNLSHYNVQVSRDGKNYKTVTIVFPKELKAGTYSAEIDLRKVKF